MPVVGVPLLECICWDHDRFGKDYLGEFDIALEDIFTNGDTQQQVRTRSLPAPLGDMSSFLSTAEMVYSHVESEIRQKEG